MSESEEWRPVPSFPGLYASSLGRIKTEVFTGLMPHGRVRKYGGKPTFGVWSGTRYIFARKGRNGKVARVVCEAFHGPAPFPNAVVMHLDEDARNNRPQNLKWGTQKENLNMPKFLAYCAGRLGANSPRHKWMMRRGANT